MAYGGNRLRKRRGAYLYGGGTAGKLCQLEKWGVSIETQGALGTENRLADEDIRRADVALLITDIELAGAERFEHCRYVQCSIYAFLREPQRVMSAVRKVLSAPQQTHLILE